MRKRKGGQRHELRGLPGDIRKRCHKPGVGRAPRATLSSWTMGPGQQSFAWGLEAGRACSSAREEDSECRVGTDPCLTDPQMRGNPRRSGMKTGLSVRRKNWAQQSVKVSGPGSSCVPFSLHYELAANTKGRGDLT